MRANNKLSTLVICNNSQRWWAREGFLPSAENHSQYFSNVWHFWSSSWRQMTNLQHGRYHRSGVALKRRSSNCRTVISQVCKAKVEEEMSWGDYGDQRNLFPPLEMIKCCPPRADWLWVRTSEPVPADFISSLASLRGGFNYSILNQLRYNASMSF